ncbi:dihydroxy-acid and 6-phosphogluconate dehydratase, partial [Caulochytrium protostelioides]
QAGKPLDIVSAFQCYGEYLSGRIDEATRADTIAHACPGAGACGGMYTANTMATAIEALGMTLPHSSSIPATHPAKLEECRRAGAVMRDLLAANLRPSDIMTRTAFENAIAVVMALGGSTNAVLHLMAMASPLGIKITLDDFQRISDRTPFIANLKPSGAYLMEDLHGLGGTPAILKYMLREGYLNGDCMTVTGKTLAENVKDARDLNFETQDVILPFSAPLKASGHLQVLRGNVAPEGSVAKITGKEGLHFEGRARVFDCE